MKIKFLKILIPFISISLGFVAFYTLIHWLLSIKFDIFHPKEMIINFFIPITISGIIVVFYFRKRIKLLKLSEKGLDFYTFICWIFLTVPVIIGQFYLENKQGKLTTVEKPSLIDCNKQTLFYSIKQAKTLNKSGGLWVTRTNADKYGNEIWINCNFACPLMDSFITENSNSIKFQIWIATTFSEKFSNGPLVDKDEQKREINRFIDSSIPKYEKYTYQTNYLRNIRHSESRDNYLAAIERTKIQINKNNLIILKEEKGTFETRTGNSHSWLLGTLISANLIWMLLIIFPSLNKTEIRKFGTTKEKEKRKGELKAILFLFTPSKRYWAMPIILDFNIGIFLIMIFSGVGIIYPLVNDLIKWGANYKPLTTDSQWWRLLTSVFLHSGFAHLIYNMIALFFIGIFLESSIGSLKFMIVYLLSGLIASLSSLFFNDPIVSVGASGAIFGMYGLVAALMILRYLDKNITAILWANIAIFLGLNLIMGLTGGIDMAAHLGGLICGLFIGFTYFPLKKLLDKHNNNALQQRA